jgi:hypothetical protein
LTHLAKAQALTYGAKSQQTIETEVGSLTLILRS